MENFCFTPFWQPNLQRVQNLTLYKQFIAQKGKVEARMTAAGITNIPVTQQLFHGTSTDVCQKVYKDGFDRSYAGKNGIAIFLLTLQFF